MGILGPYSPFLVGGSGLSFRGGVKIASGGRVPSGPFRGGPPPLAPSCAHVWSGVSKFLPKTSPNGLTTLAESTYPEISQDRFLGK